MHIDDFDEEVKRNYIRNEKLIDLKKIPEVLEKVIMVDFCEAICGDRSKLFPYFTDKRLRELTEQIGEFLMADNYTLLYHEILDKVHKAKSKEQESIYS